MSKQKKGGNKSPQNYRREINKNQDMQILIKHNGDAQHAAPPPAPEPERRRVWWRYFM